MLLAMEPHQQCGELQDRTPLHVASSRGHVRHPKMERNGWLLKLGIFLWVATYDSLGGFTTILHILQLKQIQVLMKGILHCLEQWRGRWMLELLMERKVHEDTYIYILVCILYMYYVLWLFPESIMILWVMLRNGSVAWVLYGIWTAIAENIV